MAIYAAFCINWYTSFSYNGKRRVAAHVIDPVSDYVVLPEGRTFLDVGCGSAALTLAVAKKNPKASVVGLIDGARHTPFSIAPCVKTRPRQKALLSGWHLSRAMLVNWIFQTKASTL